MNLWKFHDFSITQILREIKFWYSTTHLEALNLDFYEFLPYLKAEIYQINKIQSPKYGILELLDSAKLISRKI